MLCPLNYSLGTFSHTSLGKDYSLFICALGNDQVSLVAFLALKKQFMDLEYPSDQGWYGEVSQTLSQSLFLSYPPL